MEEESGKSGEEKRHEKKMKEIERATIDRPKEEDEERVARITNLVTERIGKTETGKNSRKKKREKRQKRGKEIEEIDGGQREKGEEKQPSNLIIVSSKD